MVVHPEITRALAAEHVRDLQASSRRPRVAHRSRVLFRRTTRSSAPTPASRRPSAAAASAAIVEIRVALARDADTDGLRRLAELDSQPELGGPALVARVEGEPVAALGLDDGRVVADPFVHTANAVELLRLRARQLSPVANGAATLNRRAVSATVSP